MQYRWLIVGALLISMMAFSGCSDGKSETLPTRPYATETYDDLNMYQEQFLDAFNKPGNEFELKAHKQETEVLDTCTVYKYPVDADHQISLFVDNGTNLIFEVAVYSGPATGSVNDVQKKTASELQAQVIKIMDTNLSPEEIESLLDRLVAGCQKRADFRFAEDKNLNHYEMIARPDAPITFYITNKLHYPHSYE